MHNSKEIHLQVVKWILHYLKGISNMRILFKKGHEMRLEVYTDADSVGLIMDKRSTTGYCIFLGGNLVTWRKKMQNVVA